MQNTDLVTRDLQTIWHPCSQMKDYENFPPIQIVGATGCYFHLANGTKVLDAISSWWCKNLGHGHPRLQQALIKQAQLFEHVIFTNTFNEVILLLSEKLTQLTRSLKKVFYASEGSSAVEIALKMTVQARQIRGQSEKIEILSLANAYHGETLFAMAVSDLGLYKKPFESYLPTVDFIQNIPYVLSKNEAIWSDCAANWQQIEANLQAIKNSLSAIIIEPIVQGAAGMQMYSADFLVRLRRWCSDNDVYLIADEIMTGLGRTGKMLACEYADIEPDFICLGKGLTAGTLPMSAVLTSNEIYDLFYDDYETGKGFLHSHTFSGNVLAAAVALECLQVIQEEGILEKSLQLEYQMLQAMQQVADKTQLLRNVRCIGGIAAADLITDKSRQGFQVFKEGIKLGAFLRPLGNTVYWLPPLNITSCELAELQDITAKAILSAMNN